MHAGQGIQNIQIKKSSSFFNRNSILKHRDTTLRIKTTNPNEIITKADKGIKFPLLTSMRHADLSLSSRSLVTQQLVFVTSGWVTRLIMPVPDFFF